VTTRLRPLALALTVLAGSTFGCGSKLGTRPTSAAMARSPQASLTAPVHQPAPTDLAACGGALGAPNRRLTRFELAYAIEDVFAVDASTLRALPRPHASIGYSPDILVGRLLDTSERFLTPYRKATDGIADQVAARIESECAGALPTPEACVVERLREPTQRLFRSTRGPEELAELHVPAAGTRGARALAKTLVKGILDSPRFYLVENEHPAGDVPAARRRLASRLALALHSSVPDLELVRRAERGELEGPGFAEELRRLRADPRFSRLSREFVRQWLRADREPLFRTSLERSEVVADPQRLAAFELQAAEWFRKVVAERRPARDLLADGSNGLLRSGLVLSALSAPIRGGGNENWLGRGILVQEAFLCRTFPLAAVYPPELWDGHPLLDPVRAQTAKRPGEVELLATRTHDRPCRECHRQLETIGAALALGEPAGAGATAAFGLGGIAGRTLSGPEEVAGFVLESGRFEPCLAKKLLTYLLSRAVLPEKRAMDRCLVDTLLASSDSGNAAVTSLIDRVLSSAAFREQGPEVVHDTPNPAPNSSHYRTALPLETPRPDACSSFDPGGFLVSNCGTEACHGAGSATFFAVHGRDRARALLRAAQPSPGGYCQKHPRLIDSANPGQSLIVQKLVAGHEVCGSPMPITGGPHLLARSEVRCFAQWIQEVAGEERLAAPPATKSP
jgi:hypothetical protein